MQIVEATPATPTTPTTTPPTATPSPTAYYNPAEEALRQYINADGNIHLAAERCNKMPLSEFVALLSEQPQALQRIMRTRALIGAFETLTLLTVELKTSIPMLEPADLLKAYTNMLSSIDKLTAAPTVTNNLNINEYMLAQLPPDAREALAVLTQTAP